MRSVKIRHGHTIKDGHIIYNETSSTYEHAESVIGFKLDRRKNYMIIDEKVCESVVYTDACSGCVPDEEYVHYTRGSGCRECGYTGRSVRGEWMPTLYLKGLEDERNTVTMSEVPLQITS